MKIVYICHPIGGDVKGNIDKIKKIIRKINLTIPDVVPFAPYLGDVISMDDSNQVERFRCIQNDFEFFKRKAFDELWVCSQTITDGMNDEIKLAEKYDIPSVFYLNGRIYAK